MSDTWRVRSNLSLEIGLRYEYSTPTYAQGNNLVNFDPSLYDPSQAVTVRTNGLLVPNSGNRFNGLIAAGDGVPEDQQGRVQLLTGGDYDLIPNGAPRGLYGAEHLFMPRASFAYTLNEATVVRGGVGRVLRQAGRQPHLLAAEHPARTRQRDLRELQPLVAVERRRRSRSARSATSTRSIRT